MRPLLLLSTRTSLLSLAVPALAMPPLLAYAGPAMAAGLLLYGGNAEVSMVELPFPWSKALIPALLGMGLLGLEWRSDKHWLWAPTILSLLASIAVSSSYLMDLMGKASA